MSESRRDAVSAVVILVVLVVLGLIIWAWIVHDDSTSTPAPVASTQVSETHASGSQPVVHASYTKVVSGNTRFPTVKISQEAQKQQP